VHGEYSTLGNVVAALGGWRSGENVSKQDNLGVFEDPLAFAVLAAGIFSGDGARWISLNPLSRSGVPEHLAQLAEEEVGGTQFPRVTSLIQYLH
jgi:hypothetical protein